MKHVKVLSHEVPAQARVETAWVSLKNVLGTRALDAGQANWMVQSIDSWLQK